VAEGTARLLLEGRPGIGKTTAARRLLNLLHEHAGRRVHHG
jgi:MoxR-like ATPase